MYKFFLFLLFNLISAVPDINLLIENQNKAVCVGTGDEVEKNGLALVTPYFYDDIQHEKFEVYKGKLTEDFENKKIRSFEKNIPPILDKRWKNLDMDKNSTQCTYSNINKKNISVIHISVRFKDMVSFKFKFNSQFYCANVYENEDRKRTFFETCSNSRNTLTNTSTPFHIWKHYSIYRKNNYFFIQPSHSVIDVAEDFIFEKIRLTSEVMEMKIHQIDVLVLNSLSPAGIYKNIKIVNKSCLSIFLFTREQCKLTFELVDDYADDPTINKQIITTKENEYKWIEIKMFFEKKNRSNEIYLNIGNSNNCNAFLDKNIYDCSDEYVDKVFVLKQITDIKPVACQHFLDDSLVQQNSPNPYVVTLSNEVFGLNNNISCKAILGTNYCDKSLICSKSQCYCSSGYKGTFCAEKCPSTWWGHSCINACPEKCKPGSCSKYTGKCEYCQPGYFGDTCSGIMFKLSLIKIYDSKAEIKIEIGQSNLLNIKEVEIQYRKLNGTKKETIMCQLNSSCTLNYLNSSSEYKICVFYQGKCVTETTFTTKCLGLEKSNFVITAGTNNVTIKTTGRTHQHCPLKSYWITVNNETQKLKNEVSVDLLISFTKYLIELKFVDEKLKLTEDSNNKVDFEFTTLQTAPGKVQNIKYFQNNHSIVFDKPTHPNGFIRNYTINVVLFKYYSKLCNAVERYNLLESHSTTNLFYQFPNWTNIFYRDFRIVVIAVNDVAAGLPETCQINFEQSGTLSTEEQLAKISVKANILNLQLPACDKIRGPLIYNFVYECCKIPNNFCTNITTVPQEVNISVSGNKTSIPKLTPYSQYDVISTTYCRNNSTCLEGIEIKSRFKTNPDAPPNVGNLESFTQNSTSIGIRFAKPFPPHGVLEFINITYCNSNGCSSTTKTNECDLWNDYKNYLCVEMNGLETTIEYNIKVFGNNKNVTKAGNITEINVLTVEKASSPPINPKYTIYENNSILLKWEYPKYPNGVLKKFIVLIMELSKRVNEEYKNTDNNITKETNITEITQLYEFLIKNLKDSSDYKVFISAESSIPGQTTEELIISTYPKKPKLSSEPMAKCNITHCDLFIQGIQDLQHENEICVYKINNKETPTLNKLKKNKKCLFNTKIDVEQQIETFKYSFNTGNSIDSKSNDKFGIIILNEFSNKTSELIKDIKIEEPPDTSGLLHLLWILTIIPPIIIFVIWKTDSFKKCKRNTTDATSEIIPLVINECRNEILKNHFGSYINKLLEEERGLEKLEDEFVYIPSVANFSRSIGYDEENQNKNRYKNIIPYDETRVVLNGIPGSEYINASYIEGDLGKKTFIATQCPKHNTVYDFWRMIWQENVNIIICLASIEEGDDKIFNYWPENFKELVHKDISITHYSDEVYTDYVIKNLEMRRNELRKLKLINYLTWPDQEIPINPLSYYYFLKHVQELDDNLNSMVVHCSAGIGRTGTFIMTYKLIKSKNEKIDIPAELRAIRNCRSNLVSKVAQYRFIYYIFYEHNYGKKHGLTLKEFTEKATKVTEDELIEDLNYVTSRQYINRLLYPYNVHQSFCPEKNRVATIMPKGPGVIYLPRLPSDNKSDYINAVYVNGYEKENKFISTQHPLENTVEDFWRLVAHKPVKLIISLQHVQEKEKYWPSNVPKLTFSTLEVILERKILKNEIAIYILKLVNLKTDKTTKITFINFKSWKSEDLVPPNMENFNDLYNYYKIEAGIDENSTVLLACHDSATACGLFIALDLVLDKFKNTNEFNLCWAVQSIQMSRIEFMNNVAQYKFIYDFVFYHHNLKHGNVSEYENINTDTIPYEQSLYENIINPT